MVRAGLAASIAASLVVAAAAGADSAAADQARRLFPSFFGGMASATAPPALQPHVSSSFTSDTAPPSTEAPPDWVTAAAPPQASSSSSSSFFPKSLSGLPLPSAPALTDTLGQLDSPLLDTPDGYDGLSQESSEIVRGMVEAFFHRQNLQEGEVDCLSKGAGKVASDMASVSANLAITMEQAVEMELPEGAREGQSGGSSQFRSGDTADAISDKVDSMSNPSSASQSGKKEAEADNQVQQEAQQQMNFFYGDRRRLLSDELMAMAPGLVMEMGGAFGKMVAISQGTMQECLHPDAIKSMDVAREHMMDMNYISGRITTNGQDIMTELADAVTSYKAMNFRKFGNDLGVCMRKVFLSTNNGKGMPGMPEGMPDPEVTANVTRGLVRGFFGEGSELDLKLAGDLDRSPTTIPVDLHKCLSKNMAFFQSVWAEIMFFFAQKSAGSEPMSQDAKMQWTSAVAFTMMGLPRALDRCNMGTEQQQMLEEAVKGMAQHGDAIHMKFKMPKDQHVSKSRVENQMAVAVKDWTGAQWETFGHDLGALLQEMVLTVFSQQYSLDDSGILQKNSVLDAPIVRSSSSTLNLGMALACAVLTSVVSVTAMRRMSLVSSRDMESFDGEDDLLDSGSRWLDVAAE